MSKPLLTEVLELPANLAVEQNNNSVVFTFPTTEQADSFFELFRTADYCGFSLAIVRK